MFSQQDKMRASCKQSQRDLQYDVICGEECCDQQYQMPKSSPTECEVMESQHRPTSAAKKIFGTIVYLYIHLHESRALFNSVCMCVYCTNSNKIGCQSRKQFGKEWKVMDIWHFHIILSSLTYVTELG